MSVYINGMEMPKNCCQCPVNMEVCQREYRYLLGHPELYDKRADDCPIISVPPHGRLIDADALVHSYYHAPSFPNLCKAINEAPTIIPAKEK